MPTKSAEPANITLQDSHPTSGRDDLTAFFAVGMIINLIVLAAFFVWAYKQWKKKRP